MISLPQRCFFFISENKIQLVMVLWFFFLKLNFSFSFIKRREEVVLEHLHDKNINIGWGHDLKNWFLLILQNWFFLLKFKCGKVNKIVTQLNLEQNYFDILIKKKSCAIFFFLSFLLDRKKCYLKRCSALVIPISTWCPKKRIFGVGKILFL